MPSGFSRFLTLLIGTCLLLRPGSVWATMNSDNYSIRFDSLSAGGGDLGASTSYKLRDQVGVGPLGDSSNSNYVVGGSYRRGVFDETLQVEEISTEDRSSQVSVSASTSSTLTVSSAAAYQTAGITCLFVIDEGLPTQTTYGIVLSGAVGNVVSFSSPLFGIPSSGGQALTAADGNRDYLYLGEDGIQGLVFPTLSVTETASRTYFWSVDSELGTGYAAYLRWTQQPENGDGETIPSVADGSVSAGEDEIGARSSDDSLASTTFDTSDSPITTSFQLVGDANSVTFGRGQAVMVKVANSGGQVGGNYETTLVFLFTGNF